MFATLINREFGAKVINLKPLVKKIPTLCEDRDKTVREETKKLIIELYRWISAALKPQLSALKPVMVSFYLWFVILILHSFFRVRLRFR